MRLKEGFVIHNVGEEHIAVATGETANEFNGLVRNNAAASAIMEQLQTATTEGEIVEAMLARYEVSREQAAADVHRIVEQLKEAGLLEL